MDIKTGNNEFYVEDQQGDKAAQITFFEEKDDEIVIDHTEVAEDLRGQSIGYQLVEHVVEKARAENKKIIPQCPYAEKQLKDNDEFHDILA